MPKKEKNVIVPDKHTMELLLSEYEALRVKEKQIKERKAAISDAIKSYAFANGTKDSNGSFYSENDHFVYGAQCRKSIKFDVDKASKFFQVKGYDECVKLIPQIVESEVEKHVSCGDITLEELESITVTSTSFAVDVKAKKEVIDEVQQTAIAASKKKPVLKRK